MTSQLYLSVILIISFSTTLTYADPKLIRFPDENEIENSNSLIETPRSEDWMSKSGVFSYNLRDLVDVFQDVTGISSIWSGLYPETKWPNRPERYMLSCRDDGEYLNLCGECVGGRTEKDDNFGLDDCGICQGLQRCSNGCREMSLDVLEEEETNCTQILGIKPNVIDLVEGSSKTLIHIIAADLKANDLICRASFGNKDLGTVEVKEHQDGLTLEFQGPMEEGKIDFSCNTTDGMEFRQQLLAVNTSKLKPISSDRSFLVFGEESKMMLTVSNMFALTDLLCFAKQDDHIIYKYWTNDIQGNSLSSEVFCERIWPKEPSNLEFGVAYSESSINLAQTIKVTVNSAQRKAVGVVVKDDQVSILFDGNIPLVQDCTALKEDPPIGKGAVCEAVANEFRIHLGKEASVKKDQTFKINLPDSKIQSVTLQHLKEEEGRASIVGPQSVCSGESVEYALNDQMAGHGMNWSIGFSGKVSKEGISPGNRQRLNLLLWRSVRENKNNWTNGKSQITVNTSQLVEGVEYELKAVSKSLDGHDQEITKTLTIAKTKSPIVYLTGTKRFNLNSDAMFEANVLCGDIENLQFAWEIGDEEPQKLQSGSKCFLKAGSFSKNFSSISVKLLKGTEVIAQDKMDLLFEPSEMLPPTLLDQIVFGTGQDIEIPMSNHNADYLYSWSCQTPDLGKCEIPGKARKDVKTVGTIDETMLRIPKGMLSIGRYEMKISFAVPNGAPLTKNVQLRIVPGEPPLLTLISVIAESDIQIALRVSDVISSCDLSIESLTSNNYTYINLENLINVEKLEGTPLRPISKDLLLKIPESRLKFDTKYKFRFNVDCGPLAQSYIVLSIPLRPLAKVAELEVTLSSGKEIKTPHKMNLKTKMKGESVYDFGLIYNETMYYIKKDVKPESDLYSFPGNVKPFIKVCQVGKICKIVYGSEMKVERGSADPLATRHVFKSYQDALSSCMYNFAIGNAKILSEATKPSKDLYKNISTKIELSLDQRMNQMDKMLEEDDTIVNDALDLLQSSMKIISMIDATEASMTKVLKFRDKIQATFKKKTGKVIQSTMLKMEPRPKRQIYNHKQIKRDTAEQSTVTSIKTLLSSSSWIIQNQKDQSSVISEKIALLKHIPDYLTDLCNTMTLTPLHAASPVAELSTIKIKNTGNRQEIRLPECSGVCSNSTGQMILGKTFFERYNNPDGICIGGAYLPYDYLTDTANYSSENNLIRLSGLYLSRVFKYVGNVVVKEVDNSTRKPLGVFRILLWEQFNYTLEGDETKCHTWIDTVGWTHTACKTLKRLTLNGKQAFECRCPLQGIHAIFKEGIQGTTSIASIIQTPTTVTTSIPPTTTISLKKETYKYTASFLIDENFNKTVGDRKVEFEQKIKDQLIERVKLPNETNLQTDNKEENIKVTLKLMYEDSRVPSVVLDMAKMLSKGNLKLSGLENQDLKVPGQNLELYLTDKKSSSSSTFVAAISCGVFILVISVVAVLLSGLFLKWRREHRAMNFIQSMENHGRPKYLKLHESSSVEAIEQSIGGSSQQRAGELDSGIVLTVDPNRIASKYQPFDQISTSA